MAGATVNLNIGDLHPPTHQSSRGRLFWRRPQRCFRGKCGRDDVGVVRETGAILIGCRHLVSGKSELPLDSDQFLQEATAVRLGEGLDVVLNPRRRFVIPGPLKAVCLLVDPGSIGTGWNVHRRSPAG
jgi:hypothetical protein